MTGPLVALNVQICSQKWLFELKSFFLFKDIQHKLLEEIYASYCEN